MTMRSSLICRVEAGHSRSITTERTWPLVVEPRHRVVRLRRIIRSQPGAGDAATGQRLEHRKPPAAKQTMQQRRDEHGLAGAGQPGDAETNRRMDEMAAEIGERAGREPGLLKNVGDRRHGAQDVGMAAAAASVSRARA